MGLGLRVFRVLVWCLGLGCRVEAYRSYSLHKLCVGFEEKKKSRCFVFGTAALHFPNVFLVVVRRVLVVVLLPEVALNWLNALHTS